MQQLRKVFMALTLPVLLVGSVNAQDTISGSGGKVTTLPGTSSTGVSLSATTGYPDVSVTTGNTTSSSGFHIFNSSATELLRIQSNGNVGIGTPSPAEKLEIYGAGNQRVKITSSDGTGSPALQLSGLGGLSALYNYMGSGELRLWAGTADRLVIQTSGNVGIGTTNPGARLDVGASGHRGGYSDVVIGAGSDIPQIELYGPNNSGVINYDGTTMSFWVNGTSWLQALAIDNGGKVGIGTATPTGILQIGLPASNYPARFLDTQTSLGIPNGVLLDMAGNSEIHVANIEIGKSAVPVIQTMGAAGQSALYLNQNSDNDVIVGSSGYTSRGLKVQSTGASSFAGSLSVGQNLTVTGTVSARTIAAITGGLQFPDGTTQTTAFAAAANGTLSMSSKVGIGVTNAQAQLQVAGDVRFGSNSPNGYTDLRIYTEPTPDAGYQQTNTVVPVTVPASGVTTKSALHFRNATVAGAGTNQLDLIIDGNITSKFQDVAEWVNAGAPLEPGTVVILDSSHDDRVVASRISYDTTVAGVVSSTPGLILGVGAEGKEKIATTGRVKVKVDATGAPIAIGDLLVTSDVPGTAMRSEPIEISGRKFHQPGTVIGKALQPLPSGRGEILVLLSLQ